MKVLVDTHSLVWALSAPELLGEESRKMLSVAEVMVSAVSLWELCLKAGRKGALLTDPLAWWGKYIPKLGIPILSIRVTDIVAQSALPPIHKDPFDRILVAQALVEKVPLISKDKNLTRYGITVIW